MEPEKQVVEFISYKDRPRQISNNTYASYCSHYRRALHNWRQTNHPSHLKEVKKWENAILRAERALPVEEKEKVDNTLLVETPLQVPVEGEKQDKEKKNDTAFKAMLKGFYPELDVEDEEAVRAKMKEINSKSSTQSQPISQTTGK